MNNEISRKNSSKLYAKSLQYFPGGVNSPVRAFKSVEGTPLFIKEGNGCKIKDEDDNEFIDFCCSWGPLILGHNHNAIKSEVISAIEKGMSFGAPTKLENELACLILDNHKFIKKLRFVSSGTEAVMSAIRLARGYTKRDKIIKFDGCYHGHADSLLVKAGSGLITFGETSSAGVPKSFASETIVLPLNDKNALEETFKTFHEQIAAIIIEPIPANNGLLLQDKEYLQFLRTICTKNKTLLIFDEVISGFRVQFEGAAGYYGIQPDIITFGKIIGGGLPVGAYGASSDIMSHISPEGNVYQAGTLSGNPVAMAAGIAQLRELLRPDFYTTLNSKTQNFVSAIRHHIQDKGYPMQLVSIGSIFWFAFSNKNKITKASDIEHSSMDKFKHLHSLLLNRGIYLGPSGYEVGFVSLAHSENDLKQAQKIICESLDTVFSNK